MMKARGLVLAAVLCAPAPLTALPSLPAAAATAHPVTPPLGPANVATSLAAPHSKHPPNSLTVAAAQLPPEILVDRHLAALKAAATVDPVLISSGGTTFGGRLSLDGF